MISRRECAGSARDEGEWGLIDSMVLNGLEKLYWA
jgi:hypothetical protein